MVSLASALSDDGVCACADVVEETDFGGSRLRVGVVGNLSQNGLFLVWCQRSRLVL